MLCHFLCCSVRRNWRFCYSTVLTMCVQLDERCDKSCLGQHFHTQLWGHLWKWVIVISHLIHTKYDKNRTRSFPIDCFSCKTYLNCIVFILGVFFRLFEPWRNKTQWVGRAKQFASAICIFINFDFYPRQRCVLALYTKYFPESCEKKFTGMLLGWHACEIFFTGLGGKVLSIQC